jgi:glycosyltransferase involved in cell wall biosynthesis
MKTILASAYAVNPFKGSEDGMGWNFIYQIARFNKVIAVTRENNRVHIERYMNENPDVIYENISFIYFDLPYWMRFWKKGGRGAMLYFWLWQRALPGFVKQQNLNFDVTHNVNFHNDWTPSYLWKLGKPFVWGPIGHHPVIPSQYLKPFKRQIFFKDRLIWMLKKIFWKYSGSLKNTVKYADHIICMNKSVPDVLNLRKKQFSIVPSVATEDFGFEKKDGKQFNLISAGRLVPLKGFDLSILAFASFFKTLTQVEKSKCKLIIVGSGPEEQFLKNLAEKNGVKEHVQFINWIERNELLKLYSGSSAFLFPSHEGAGMVVAEALSFGLPVICLNNAGPGEFITSDCGFAIPPADYQHTVANLSNAINTLYNDQTQLKQMSIKARERFENYFNWDNRGIKLHAIYQNL